jgi:hypothetical protein
MKDIMIEPYKKQPNYLLTMSQATRVLGNKDYRLVENLIRRGLLKTYNIPGSKRVLLKYHEVMSLPKTDKQD